MVSVTNLLCDYRASGAVLGDTEPAFSWAVVDLGGRGIVAHQVLVASSPDLLSPGRADRWDSGRVAGERCEAHYSGRPLKSRERCWWAVRVWAPDEECSDFADPAWFELGLRAEEWTSDWMGYLGGWYGQALRMRRRWHVEDRHEITRANVYVMSVGWHQLRLNGSVPDKRVLEPAPTVLEKRLICSSYDVGHLLRDGDNVLALVLGGGWYGQPSARVQVYIDSVDGSTLRLDGEPRTGDEWEVAPAEILSSSPYDGEVVDLRFEEPGWDRPGERARDVAWTDRDDGVLAAIYGRPGSRERAWTRAQSVDGPVGSPVFPILPPAVVTEENAAVTINEPVPGVFVADAGSNGAGWARLRASGTTRGQRVELRYGEALLEDGRVNQENLRSARSSDLFISDGRRLAVFEPTFTNHGFRYVEISGLHKAPAPEDVVIRRARTPGAQRSHFRGEELLQRIWAMAVRTEASNTLGMLTDCPQRNERQGWLNDLTDRLDTAVLVHDIAPLLCKLLDDIADSQGADGSVPDTVPFRWGYRVADPVCLAPIIIPRLVLRHWGDERVIEKAYPVARAWARYLSGRRGENDGVLRLTRWGDWAEPNQIAPAGPLAGQSMEWQNPPAHGAVSQRTPGALVSTACLYKGLVELSALAELVGDTEEAERSAVEATQVRKAFRHVFWHPATGSYGSGSQGSLACALGLGLVPQEELAHVVGLLADDVRARGYLTTGNVATKFVLETLSDEGYHDLALVLALRKTYPSWGYMLDRGATTLWERWEEATGGGMNSHNHGMLGAIGSWLITRHAGLRVSGTARASDRWEVVIPRTSYRTHAEAEIDSPRGTAEVKWASSGNSLHVSLRVPEGTEAVVTVPTVAGASLPTGFVPSRSRGYATGTVRGPWEFSSKALGPAEGA
ncbi:MAG TPA: family 78 glycoside hydrolase catalytic domain [Acidimicrobiales bacterium]|nr:family 78 glycoside hydrolase catalytic domain [Acidimicrobiales bacterium]